jgi:spore germination protein GerM
VRTPLAVTSLAALGVLGFALAGCNSDEPVSLGPPPARTTSTSGSGVTGTTGTASTPSTQSFEVWFARGGRLVPELRTHAATPRIATAALAALLAGPTRAERASGVATAIPGGTRPLGISIRDGIAKVDLTSEYQSGGGSLSMQVRLAQVVYTLTQFPTVKAVRFQLDGRPVDVFSGEGIVLDHPVGRSDYRDLSSLGPEVPGSWRSLPPAPIAIDAMLTSVWTGREMLVYGVSGVAPDGNFLKAVNVAAAYDPATRRWRTLPRPIGRAQYLGNHHAVWTGKEMLVWGTRAFDPATNRWRRLPPPPAGGGIVVWTGREMLGWGGGCCGDASADGAAYHPATNTWRRLARAPLAGRQDPTGAWTGRELIIFPGRDPDGKVLEGAAAYNPRTDTWRRIASLPLPPPGANAVWDGREVLVAGGTGAQRAPSRVGFAYDPTTNRSRRLPAMDFARTGAAAVWSGQRLLVWGGGAKVAGADSPVIPPHGLAYGARSNRWSPLPQAPLLGRIDPAGVWTGREMIVWGGEATACRPDGPCHTRRFADGAAFTPTRGPTR